MPMRAAPGCSFGKLLANQPGSASFRCPTRITMPGIGGAPAKACVKLLTKALPMFTPNFSFGHDDDCQQRYGLPFWWGKHCFEPSWPETINHKLPTISALRWPMKNHIIFSPVDMRNGN